MLIHILLLPFSCQVVSDSFAIPRTVPWQAPLSMGFPRQEYLQWVAISFSRGSSWPRDHTRISCIGRWVLYHWATWEALSTSLWWVKPMLHNLACKSPSQWFSFSRTFFLNPQFSTPHPSTPPASLQCPLLPLRTRNGGWGWVNRQRR